MTEDLPEMRLDLRAARLEKELGAPVRVDWSALDADGLDGEVRVGPIRGRGIAWRDALQFSMVLRRLEIAPRRGELKITALGAGREYDLALFDVGDLTGGDRKRGERLVEIVQARVGAPGAWVNSPGTSARLLQGGATLAVRHGYWEREATAELLADFRALAAARADRPTPAKAPKTP